MNVCIVEDSVLIQDRLKQMIETLTDVIVAGIAGDLKSANQLIFGRGAADQSVDAIILDTQLPDGNSIEILKRIKRELPRIKVVVFSNHASEDCRTIAQHAGADSFLDKSADSEKLASLLQSWQQSSHQPN